MVIKKLSKKNGKPVTNVEVCRTMHKILKQMRDGVNGENQTLKDENYQKYLKICNNEDDGAKIMRFLDDVVASETDDEAQLKINKGLIPIK